MPSYVANDAYLVGGRSEDSANAESSAGPTSEIYPDYSTQSRAREGDAIGPSMLIQTGPNYSGKSVYLKQVALIVYMAHVGRCVAPGVLWQGARQRLTTLASYLQRARGSA